MNVIAIDGPRIEVTATGTAWGGRLHPEGPRDRAVGRSQLRTAAQSLAARSQTRRAQAALWREFPARTRCGMRRFSCSAVELRREPMNSGNVDRALFTRNGIPLKSSRRFVTCHCRWSTARRSGRYWVDDAAKKGQAPLGHVPRVHKNPSLKEGRSSPMPSEFRRVLSGRLLEEKCMVGIKISLATSPQSSFGTAAILEAVHPIDEPLGPLIKSYGCSCQRAVFKFKSSRNCRYLIPSASGSPAPKSRESCSTALPVWDTDWRPWIVELRGY